MDTKAYFDILSWNYLLGCWEKQTDHIKSYQLLILHLSFNEPIHTPLVHVRLLGNYRNQKSTGIGCVVILNILNLYHLYHHSLSATRVGKPN